MNRVVDRKPTKPNRYKITEEDGSFYYATINNDDDPIEMGSPIDAKLFNSIIDDLNTMTPKNHAVNSGIYGLASNDVYGHTRVVNSSSARDYASSFSSVAGYNVYNKLLSNYNDVKVISGATTIRFDSYTPFRKTSTINISFPSDYNFYGIYSINVYGSLSSSSTWVELGNEYFEIIDNGSSTTLSCTVEGKLLASNRPRSCIVELVALVMK